MKRLLLPPLLALLTASLAFAAKDADLKPTLATPGKIVFEGAFETGALAKPWNVAKGDWQVRDGAIVGKEKADDKHAAVLFLQSPARDSVIRFSYKLDGAKDLALSFNHPKGHLFRILLREDSIAIVRDKDKKDPASKAGSLGRTGAKLPAGEWHTVLVEVKGEQVKVQTDTGAKVEGRDPALAVEKTGYRFVIKGESLLLDDVKVWSVAP